MQGAYIYFVINMSDVPDYKKMTDHIYWMRICYFWMETIFGTMKYLIVT